MSMDSNLPQGWFRPTDLTFYKRVISELPEGSTFAEIGSWR